jgi:hypothetical protein
VPLVTYLGPRYAFRRPDTPDEFTRGNTVEVSQEWIDTYRKYLFVNNKFDVKGDAGVTTDGGNDGIPDSGWTKKDIGNWLKAQGVGFAGYATKSKLLGLAEAVLNPPAPEPAPEPEMVPEAPAEAPEEVETLTQENGDEE